MGIELEKPAFEAGTSIQVFEYADRVPPTSEAFHEALQAIYTQHDAVLPASIIFEKAPLDLYTVFKLVAARGGYAAVTVRKYGGCVCIRVPCLFTMGSCTRSTCTGSGKRSGWSTDLSLSQSPTCRFT